MTETPTPLIAFNRGLVSPKALARLDQTRLALSAETMTNWMPNTLGSMTLRPGTQHLGSTASNNAAKFIPFIFGTNDTALIEITASKMRVWVSEEAISRVAVSAAVGNGTFDTDLSSWTDADEAGGVSQWVTGGYMGLTGTTFNAAIQQQTISVVAGDQNLEHALRLVVERGRVTLKVGSTAGGLDYLDEQDLLPGEYSLAFTPTGDFHIELSSFTQYETLVDSIAVESSGDMEVTAPWSDLANMRWDQSGDVVFVAGGSAIQQRRIERRASRSWAVAEYETEDGPYRIQNITGTRLTPSGLTGNITLTSSTDLFKSTSVDSIYRLQSIGQKVSAAVTAEAQWTEAIRVVGVDNARIFQIDVAGTWTATVTLQRSVGEEGNWTDVTTYTSNQVAVQFDDTLDNEIIFYRIGVDTGDFGSGTATCTLTYSGGSITGNARVVSFTSAKVVGAIVLDHLGQTTATETWWEGVWSTRRGYPSSVLFNEGRLWWFGKNWIVGSVTDAFDSFDDNTVGDSGPIVRTIGSGPVDTINWALPLQPMVIGADGAEKSVGSTTRDEVITPTNFHILDVSTQGSGSSIAATVDKLGIFIQRSKFRIYLISPDPVTALQGSSDLTLLNPDLGNPAFTLIAVQRQPDTRLHCLRSDGTVAILVFNDAEDVRAWVNYSTDGTVEDIVVLPGTEEDAVYYVVNRTINSVTKRYLEKWAKESECLGGVLNKQADSFKTYTGEATTVITGADHLEGENIVVWAAGADVGTDTDRTQLHTVVGGSFTLSVAATNVVYGMPYNAQWKSAKLVIPGIEKALALTRRERVKALGLIMYKTHYQGIRYGEAFDKLDELPLIENGVTTAADTIWDSYDFDAFPFAGDTGTDPRLCLQADAPRPCTVLAAVPKLET